MPRSRTHTTGWLLRRFVNMAGSVTKIACRRFDDTHTHMHTHTHTHTHTYTHTGPKFCADSTCIHTRDWMAWRGPLHWRLCSGRWCSPHMIMTYYLILSGYIPIQVVFRGGFCPLRLRRMVSYDYVSRSPLWCAWIWQRRCVRG